MDTALVSGLLTMWTAERPSAAVSGAASVVLAFLVSYALYQMIKGVMK